MRDKIWPRLTGYSLCWLFAYGIWAALVWYVNIIPLHRSGQDEIAFINIALLLFAPIIFKEAQYLGVKLGYLVRIFVAAAMFGCYYNSLNGVSGKKDDTVAEKQGKQEEYAKWQTTIETLDNQKKQLPSTYTYVSDVAYKDKKEERDTANRTRDHDCDPAVLKAHRNDSTDSQGACEHARSEAKRIQEAFDVVSQNYGITVAHKDLATAIKNAEIEQAKLGFKPKYADPAAGRISKATNGWLTEQGLIEFMPMLFAFLADIGFTFVPALTMGAVRRRFKSIWGERWWEQTMELRVPVVRPTPEVIVAPTLIEEHPPEEVSDTPTLEAEPPPEVKRLPPPKKLERDDYIPGVLNWKKGLIFTDQGDRQTPSELHLRYAKFCEGRGIPIAPLNTFGSILKNEGKVTPKKVQGKTVYRIKDRPAMELVKG